MCARFGQGFWLSRLEVPPVPSEETKSSQKDAQTDPAEAAIEHFMRITLGNSISFTMTIVTLITVRKSMEQTSPRVEGMCRTTCCDMLTNDLRRTAKTSK